MSIKSMTQLNQEHRDAGWGKIIDACLEDTQPTDVCLQARQIARHAHAEISERDDIITALREEMSELRDRVAELKDDKSNLEAWVSDLQETIEQLRDDA